MANARRRLGQWLAKSFVGSRGAPAPGHRHQSFLVYGDLRYLKLAVMLCMACLLLYGLYVPAKGRGGDTLAGYFLGLLGAGLIGWLAWLGVRKRSFTSGKGSLQAWTSAHVYLGLSLLVIASLHCAFRFGPNVHTLAYLLMVLVIISGVYGIVAYATLPRRITGNRHDMDFRAMLAEILRLNAQAVAHADKIDPDTHAMIARSIDKMRIGGTAWQQITGRYEVAVVAMTIDRFLQDKTLQVTRAASAASFAARPSGEGNTTIFFIADQMFDAAGGPETETLQKLVELLSRRKSLVDRINRDITLRARQNIWLYAHVPLTIALLAALFVHVVAVFSYW